VFLMFLEFIGAAHEVTGSCHFLEIGGKRLLVDCGMEQGANVYENQDIPVNAGEIDYILLTHAHIDHTGLVPLMYARVSPIEREKVAREALIKVGLGARISHRPFQMSGGQQQRVAVARALAGNPPLILADEPTGNLDSKSSDEILNLLLDANNAGHTVILITHDDKIARRANRVICISDGEIISDTIQ